MADAYVDDFLNTLGDMGDFVEGAASRVEKNPVMSPPNDQDWIIVSEDQHAIGVYRQGQKVRTINDFSTGGSWDGKPHPTPRGRFRVIRKDKDHVSSSYKDRRGNPAKMPFYVQFASAVGFHVGDPEVRSHGCIHLTRADAEYVFNFAREEKTNVWVMDRKGKPKVDEDGP